MMVHKRQYFLLKLTIAVNATFSLSNVVKALEAPEQRSRGDGFPVIGGQALKMIIESEHQVYFVHQNNLIAKTNSPDEKFKTALHLYNYFISE